MSKVKLHSAIEQQIADSAAFWAGKPKLSQDALSAIDTFAKQKGRALDEFCSIESSSSALAQLAIK